MSELVLENELELPKGWKWCKFQDVTDVVRGGSPRPKGNPKYFGGTIPWIMIRDITKEKGKFLTKTKDTVTEEGAKKSRLLKKGSLILSNSGTVCVPKILKVEGCIHDGFLTFPDIPKNMNIDYAYYWFEKIRTKIRQENQQGVVQVNLNIQIVKIIDVPLPPLNEQKRIVSKIEELFSKIDSAKQLLEHTKLQLEQYRQSLLKSAFEGKLTEAWRKNNINPNLKFFLDYTFVNINEQNESIQNLFSTIPKTWRIFELAQIADVIDPHPSHRAPPVEANGFPFAGIGDIDENGTINVTHSRKVGEKFIKHQENSYQINENSLGYGRVGTVGKVIRLRKQDFRYSLSPTLAVINNKKIIKSELLFHELNSTQFFQQVSQNITGTTRSAIGIIKLRKILLSVPPLEEQEQIVSQIEQGFSLIENTTQIVNSSLQNLQTMKMSILKQAFEGKLVPQDPNDEPASALLEKIKLKN